MKIRGMLALASVVLVAAWASPTAALTGFKKPFDARYVKDSGDEEFVKEYKKQNCNACHVKSKPRDVVNAYGMELAKLIPGNAKQRLAEAKAEGDDQKDAEEEKILAELAAALRKVEGLRSSSGPTYGEILKAHKLPIGEAVGSVKPAADGVTAE